MDLIDSDLDEDGAFGISVTSWLASVEVKDLVDLDELVFEVDDDLDDFEYEEVALVACVASGSVVSLGGCRCVVRCSTSTAGLVDGTIALTGDGDEDDLESRLKLDESE